MGVWNGVGGKIEKGETSDMGAQREVFEETGIEVESFFSKGTVKPGRLQKVNWMEYMYICLWRMRI